MSIIKVSYTTRLNPNEVHKLLDAIKKYKFSINETIEHKTLKRKSVLFLKKLGCSSIKMEHSYKNIETNKHYRFDVTGGLYGKLIVVECGNLTNKSEDFINLVKLGKIICYIYPYKSENPILYQLV